MRESTNIRRMLHSAPRKVGQMDLNDPKIIGVASALIGSLVATLASLRIFWWKRTNDVANRLMENIEKRSEAARAESRKNLDAFRLYADPLAAASKSLHYRLKEILEEDGRTIYLDPNAPHSDYNEYKRWSTLYRLSSTIGWIRAFRREKTHLDIGFRSPNQEIEEAIDLLEMKLADGPHIEERRAHELLRAFRVKTSPPMPHIDKKALSILIENTLRSKLGSAQANSAHELGNREQDDLIKLISKDISAFSPDPIEHSLFPEQREEVIRILGIKEAWMFRDWQQAIGDFMIRPAKGGSRLFDVIGYGDFILEAKKALYDEKDKDHCWIRNLYNLFNDLQPKTIDIFDARNDQLISTAAANERLKNAIEVQKSKYIRSSMSPSAIQT